MAQKRSVVKGIMQRVPGDGYVRVSQSPNGVCFMRAWKEWPPDEPMRYMDLRAGLPTWNREIVFAVKDALSRCEQQIAALIEQERAGYKPGFAYSAADVVNAERFVPQDDAIVAISGTPTLPATEDPSDPEYPVEGEMEDTRGV